MRTTHSAFSALPAALAAAILLAGLPAGADDIKAQPAPGSGFVVQNAAGTEDWLRLNESGQLWIRGSGAGLTLFADPSSLRIGLGTLTPNEQLELTGNLRLPTSTPTTGNLFKAADRFLTNPGTRNVFLGIRAGNFGVGGADNTGLGYQAQNSISAGTGNTGLGSQAMQATSSGSYNTGVGYNALLTNSSGSANVAVGTGAMSGNTTASRSTAVGTDALRSSTADENAAFGVEALLTNTSGVGNTALGAVALKNLFSGSDNTAVGHYAMASAVGGNGNTAVGAVALGSGALTGSANVAVGQSAAASNSTGQYNVAVGQSSLASNTTGSYNTAIGLNALSGLVGGTDNIAIGSNSTAAKTSGDSNIYISANDPTGTENYTIRIGHGTQTRTFVAAVRGVVTGIADAIPVLVDSAGQLGTISSSRRFKENIAEIPDASDLVERLHPVSFTYKEEYSRGGNRQYGLIAEEVASVAPELAVFDEQGQPLTVRYHLLDPLLIKALQQQGATIQRLTERLERLERLEAALSAQTPQPAGP